MEKRAAFLVGGAEGLSRQELRRGVASKRLERVRRGVYVAAEDFSERERHLLLIRATVPELHADNVVSHQSAALLHGLPLPRGGLTRVEVTRPAGPHGRRGAGVHLRNAPLVPADLEVIDGIVVTSLARTAVDVARILPYEWGVVACDAALRGGCSPEALAAEVESGRRRKGNGIARAAVAFADARAESPAESMSRVSLARAGIPAPELQYVVEHEGRFVARGDFAWVEKRVIGEVDGRIKYGELLAPGQTAADVVMAEKEREQGLRDAGWWFVRWGWKLATRPQELGVRVRRAFDLAR